MRPFIYNHKFAPEQCTEKLYYNKADLHTHAPTRKEEIKVHIFNSFKSTIVYPNNPQSIRTSEFPNPRNRTRKLRAKKP